MLSHLTIKNMAIIEKLSLDFSEKMTVLTGETGAGKSIIIDSISLLLGDRASADVIRHNEERATIEAVFNPKISPKLVAFFDEYDIEYEASDGIVIKRTIKKGGGSQVRINGELVTVNQLKELGSFLVDIHVQHDTFRLFKPEAYYDLIDNLVTSGKLHRLREGYLEALGQYKDALVHHKDFEKNAKDMASKLTQLTAEHQELSEANLVADELGELEEQQKLMADGDKLHGLLENLLEATGGENQAMESLYPALELARSLAQVNPKFDAFSEKINDLYYSLEDLVDQITKESKGLMFDPSELDRVEIRIGELRRLERKYKMDVAELMAYRDKIQMELEQFEDVDAHLEELVANIKTAHQQLIDAGETLNDARVKVADKVKAALVKELSDLKLPNAEFDITFDRVAIEDEMNGNYSSNGLYHIDFMLTTNKGEPPKPLNKVASGGELSRIMLALKSILNRGQSIETIIFDEIDTGVSGQVATSIGAKMQEISEFKQVLCITHLPQVASYAHHHLHVSKSDQDGRTTTQVNYLEGDARIHEIAVMMSDETVTEASLNNAREMLANKVAE